jgi:hypothetical protein
VLQARVIATPIYEKEIRKIVDNLSRAN